MSSGPGDRVAAAVGAVLGVTVVGWAVVHDGDVAAAFRLDLAGGGALFAKTHPQAPPGFFTTEAAGLSWLRAAGAVPVPEVLAVSGGPASGGPVSGGPVSGGPADGPADGPAGDGSLPFLALEWIEVGRARPDDAAFGRALAALHDAGAPCFGREDRRTTGSRGLPNEPRDRWAEFYAECRLLPLARLARDTGALPAGVIVRLERLASGLDRYDDGSPPCRLHGDLWAGNRLVDTRGRSWLVDPAAHGGHREFDLAMMRLFGGFGSACFAAYEEVHPLADGWQDRVALHQIAPLVVHAVKFGGGYVRSATEAIGRY